MHRSAAGLRRGLGVSESLISDSALAQACCSERKEKPTAWSEVVDSHWHHLVHLLWYFIVYIVTVSIMVLLAAKAWLQARPSPSQAPCLA